MNPDKHQNALNQNDRLHWYEIKSILGQGGFGITYLARDTNLNHDVAIKEYLPIEFSARDPSGAVKPISEEHAEMFEWGKTRFLDEARTLVAFNHPNIVRVLSFFEFNSTGYMVMEYVEGLDFADLIGPAGSLDEDHLLAIIVPILEGLEQVHDQGYVHRDIKPRNIVIRNDGSPVLIDFGSARQAMREQTRTLTSLVTPGYSPMEQYHQAIGKQGPWTDIYALGATLYAGVTGKKPADALKRSAARSGKEPEVRPGRKRRRMPISGLPSRRNSIIRNIFWRQSIMHLSLLPAIAHKIFPTGVRCCVEPWMCPGPETTWDRPLMKPKMSGTYSHRLNPRPLQRQAGKNPAVLY